MPKKNVDVDVEEQEDDDEVEEQTAEDEEDEEQEEQTDSQEREHIKRLNAEAKKHRLRAKELANKLRGVTKQLNDLKDQGVSKAEQNKTIRELRLRIAFNEACYSEKINDRDTIWMLVADDLRAIEVSDDGEVDTEKLALIVESAGERYPWAKSAETADGSTALPKSPTLSSQSGISNKRADRAALAKKYPALTQQR